MLDPAVAANCVVIGCDSMLYLDGRLVGKPASPDAARDAVAVDGRAVRSAALRALRAATDSTAKHRRVIRIIFHHSAISPSPRTADLQAYLDTGEPLAVAGSFTLDGFGGWFVDRIEGDPSNVIGLSLPLTRTMLQPVGLSVAETVGRPIRSARDRRPADRQVGSRCVSTSRSQPHAERIRPPGTAGDRRLAGRQPGSARAWPSPSPTKTCCCTSRPHPRRGQTRLAHRPQRPACPRLRRRPAIRRLDGPQRHFARRPPS